MFQKDLQSVVKNKFLNFSNRQYGMLLLQVFLFYLILNVLSNQIILHGVLANVVKKLKKNYNAKAVFNNSANNK